jgi:hypothetical protein
MVLTRMSGEPISVTIRSHERPWHGWVGVVGDLPPYPVREVFQPGLVAVNGDDRQLRRV